MSLSWHIGISLLLSVFISTAYASDYGESNVIGGFRVGGYADSRINGNTAVIYYDGTSYDSPSLVRKFLLYRAAQVTIKMAMIILLLSLLIHQKLTPRCTHKKQHNTLAQIPNYTINITRRRRLNLLKRDNQACLIKHPLALAPPNPVMQLLLLSKCLMVQHRIFQTLTMHRISLVILLLILSNYEDI